MMKYIVFSLFPFFFSSFTNAQLSVVDSFNPSETGGMCGIAHSITDKDYRIYTVACGGSNIHEYDSNETFIRSIPMPGGRADDVDLEIASADFTLGDSLVKKGDLLVINGESNEVVVYAIDVDSGTIITSLTTKFGNSHVVGGAYNSRRNSFFFIQDNVPAVALENMVAEVNPITGDVMNSYQVTDDFSVYYGDLDISETSGHLFIVSSSESSIAEYTPLGDLVREWELPSGASGLSGISIGCAVTSKGNPIKWEPNPKSAEDYAKIWLASGSNAVMLDGFDCGALTVSTNDEFSEKVNYYPNPVRDELTIQLDQSYAMVEVNVLNAQGQLVQESVNFLNTSTLNLSMRGKEGIYFVHVNTSVGKRAVLKVSKE